MLPAGQRHVLVKGQLLMKPNKLVFVHNQECPHVRSSAPPRVQHSLATQGPPPTTAVVIWASRPGAHRHGSRNANLRYPKPPPITTAAPSPATDEDLRVHILCNNPKQRLTVLVPPSSWATSFLLPSWQQNLPKTHTQDQDDPVGALGTLQLRRVLRAIGLPTVGLQQAVLAERLREALVSGQAALFAAKARSTRAGPNQCGELLV